MKRQMTLTNVSRKLSLQRRKKLLLRQLKRPKK